MADLLAEAAAFTNLLQAWRALEKRLPAAPRLRLAPRRPPPRYRRLAGGGDLRALRRARRLSPHRLGQEDPVPRLKDRLVLLALKQALQPRAERFFIHDTYAGLPGRGGHRAA